MLIQKKKNSNSGSLSRPERYVVSVVPLDKLEAYRGYQGYEIRGWEWVACRRV